LSELSSVTQTDVNLPFITADQNGPKHLNRRIALVARFDKLLAVLVFFGMGVSLPRERLGQGWRRYVGEHGGAGLRIWLHSAPEEDNSADGAGDCDIVRSSGEVAMTTINFRVS
jgi:hypothetical protein